jgi:hypothetical protein
MKKLFILPLIAGSMLMLNSCKKVEGEGGSSKITGIAIENKYNSVGNIIASYPAADQDIYIVYGTENTYFDDDIKTSYDGSFEFNYLQPGTYTIYTYEDCSSCGSGQKEVLMTVEITEKKSTVVTDTLYIKKL